MVEQWIETLYEGKLILEKDIVTLCGLLIEILQDEGNVQYLNAPIFIVGDIHGQFYDMLEMLKTCGRLPNSQYLFLGDYVDRGYNSLETILLLLCLKLKYPSQVFLLRGNHESRQISQTYGFYEEVNRKFGGLNIWRHLNNVFDYLSIAAVTL